MSTALTQAEAVEYMQDVERVHPASMGQIAFFEMGVGALVIRGHQGTRFGSVKFLMLDEDEWLETKARLEAGAAPGLAYPGDPP